MQVQKAFYKSKAFYGCISAIVLVVGDMVANGVTMGNMVALASAGFALYGRIVATAPLGMSDQHSDDAAASEADVEQAKADVRKSDKKVDADHGN